MKRVDHILRELNCMSVCQCTLLDGTDLRTWMNVYVRILRKTVTRKCVTLHQVSWPFKQRKVLTLIPPEGLFIINYALDD